jgi:hypothetical protein
MRTLAVCLCLVLLSGTLSPPEAAETKDLSAFIEEIDSLAKSGTEKALDTVVNYARRGSPDMRAIAMGSLVYLTESPKAQEALSKGLLDADASVRAAALRACGKVREKFVISAVIDMLGREKEEALKVNALKLLVRFTEQNMGLVEEDWRKWWELAEPRFEFPKEGKEGAEKGFTDVRVRDLSYFGIEIASKRMGFLVDISSSMTEQVPVRPASERDSETGAEGSGKTAPVKGEGEGEKDGDGGGKGMKARKIDILKKELVRVLRKLPPDAAINILTFHRTFGAWQKQLQPLAGPGRAKAISYVEGLQTGVGTNVFDTLESALKDRRIDTIYLLTDGLPTAGRITDRKAILEEIRTQNRVRGATIHCIAFGEESPLLKDLAADNGGEYRFVDRY